MKIKEKIEIEIKMEIRKERDRSRDQNGDKEKDSDQNRDKDKGIKPIKYVHWNKEKVDNETWFKAKIEGPGRYSYMYGYNNCHTYSSCMHACFFSSTQCMHSDR